MEDPEFDSKIMFEGGKRMSWRSYGVNMCIAMACGSICWPICRTCEEMESLCIVLVHRNT